MLGCRAALPPSIPLQVISHYKAGTEADGCGPDWGGCTDGLRRAIEAALEDGGSPPLVPGDHGPFACAGSPCPSPTVDCGYLSAACDSSIGKYHVTLTDADGSEVRADHVLAGLFITLCG